MASAQQLQPWRTAALSMFAKGETMRPHCTCSTGQCACAGAARSGHQTRHCQGDSSHSKGANKVKLSAAPNRNLLLSWQPGCMVTCMIPAACLQAKALLEAAAAQQHHLQHVAANLPARLPSLHQLAPEAPAAAAWAAGTATGVTAAGAAAPSAAAGSKQAATSAQPGAAASAAAAGRYTKVVSSATSHSPSMPGHHQQGRTQQHPHASASAACICTCARATAHPALPHHLPVACRRSSGHKGPRARRRRRSSCRSPCCSAPRAPQAPAMPALVPHAAGAGLTVLLHEGQADAGEGERSVVGRQAGWGWGREGGRWEGGGAAWV